VETPLTFQAAAEIGSCAGFFALRVVLTGLDSLTASERRIAELASQSLTNREIAQQLFITEPDGRGST
jgi:DNA-binding NarL/FixJ family response regulator